MWGVVTKRQIGDSSQCPEALSRIAKVLAYIIFQATYVSIVHKLIPDEYSPAIWVAQSSYDIESRSFSSPTSSNQAKTILSSNSVCGLFYRAVWSVELCKVLNDKRIVAAN